MFYGLTRLLLLSMVKCTAKAAAIDKRSLHVREESEAGDKPAGGHRNGNKKRILFTGIQRNAGFLDSDEKR